MDVRVVAASPSTPSSAGDLGPVAGHERVDALDVLRGAALLGILVVNVEIVRGADLYLLLAGQTPDRSPADATVQFLTGWLVKTKFLSAFALLFGVGAALMVRRVLRAGGSPRRLLARRYGWLVVFGLAHLLLLFPGDILLVYGLAGLALLPFVFQPPRTLLRWAVAITAGYTLLLVVMSALAQAFGAQRVDPVTVRLQELMAARRVEIIEAYTSGGLAQQLDARAWEALFVQSGHLGLLPWLLALFLAGLAIGRSGIVTDLDSHRFVLRRAAVIGLGVGLVLNLPLGFAGPFGAAAYGPDAGGVLPLVVPVAQRIGAPLLAVGYLAALALVCLRPRVRTWLSPLRDVGRIALTGYVLQSVLATGLFVGLGRYDTLSSTDALGVVAGIWVVLLVVGVLWQRLVGRGPLEQLWRRLTYGGTTTNRRCPPPVRSDARKPA